MRVWRTESAANCDDIATISRTRRGGRLGTPKLFELDRALKIALGLT